MVLTSSNITEHGEKRRRPEYKAGPRQRPPTHPGQIVASALDELNISVRAAAAAIGVTPSALGNIIKGKSGVTPQMALRLGAYFGNGAELWLGLQQDHDLWHAREAMRGTLKAIRPALRGAD
jgi:addiction module HigA family antidote